MAQFPGVKDGSDDWRLPEPQDLGKPKVDSRRWREVLVDDEARVR